MYHSLSSGDSHLSCGSEKAKFFDEDLSPFAGFPEDYTEGFEELYSLLPPSRNILYATRELIEEPAGWQLKHFIKGLQFVFNGNAVSTQHSSRAIQLGMEHVDEMMALAKLTRPGPFNRRTIEFGHYHGIFDNDKLVAMTGQRLHVYDYSEISAVCTHPGWLGKGFAALLVQHQLSIICASGQMPFLHVRNDNTRAIALYERLGFTQNGTMNFYFLKRK